MKENSVLFKSSPSTGIAIIFLGILILFVGLLFIPNDFIYAKIGGIFIILGSFYFLYMGIFFIFKREIIFNESEIIFKRRQKTIFQHKWIEISEIIMYKIPIEDGNVPQIQINTIYGDKFKFGGDVQRGDWSHKKLWKIFNEIKTHQERYRFKVENQWNK